MPRSSFPSCRRLPVWLLMLAWTATTVAGDAVPAPATPPAITNATDAKAEFQPDAVLSDGSRSAPLWPGPAATPGAGPVWKDSQGKIVAADRVVRVLLSATPPPVRLSQGAVTFDGQRIVGSIDSYSETDGLKVSNPVLGPVQIPAALLSRVYIQEAAGGEEDELPVGLARPNAGGDGAAQKNLAVYRNADQADSRLFFLADGLVKLKAGDDIATVPLERLAFLSLAAPAQLPPTARELQVLLTDGTRVTGDVVAATADQLTLKSTVGSLKIPRPLIHSLWPHRAGFRLLARLTPTALKNHGQFDVHFPPRINRTAAGRPFAAAEFNLAGIGMHSYTRAEYALAGATTFVAFVALDQAAPEQAACAVRVYVDGTKKFEVDLTRKNAARWIAVPTAGGKALALEVDFGADQSDTGDLVDWINAILLQ